MEKDKVKLLRQKLEQLEPVMSWRMKEEVVCCGITIAQRQVLTELSHASEMCLAQLANKLGLDSSTLSRTTNRMVEAELVDRVINACDRRYVSLVLTDKGKKVLSEMDYKCNDNCSEAMTNAIRSVDTAGIKSILKSGYSTHLTDVVEFTQSAAIKGGHNKTKFFKYLSDNGIQIKELSRTPHPSINGVEVVKYQIPAKDAAGNIIKDASGNTVWKSTQFEKTIFDPNVISEAQMLEMGEQAMKEGLDALRLTPQTNSNTIINGVAPNGLKFTGYWNPTTGLIENFHPVL